VRVVLSADGADESRAVRDWCVSHLNRTSSVLAVLGINALGEFVKGSPVFDLTESIDAVVARIEREVCRPLAVHGVPCRIRVGPTGHAQSLIEAAETEQADLIVIGRVPPGPFGDAIRGESVTYPAHRPPCPVLIVPIHNEMEAGDRPAAPHRRAES
jgi:nucleotide-binding universal stress UspA family protein